MCRYLFFKILYGLLLFILLVLPAARAAGQNCDQAGPDGLLAKLDPMAPGMVARIFAPGRISTPATEWGMAICPNGDDIYYTVAENKNSVIVWIRYEGGQWSKPEPVSFSGKYRDGAPVLSRDGRLMIFISNRPVTPGGESGDGNLWAVRREAGAWGEPYYLNQVNSVNQEFFPCLAANGDLYFCLAPGGKGTPAHIFVSRPDGGGVYQKPEPLRGAINTLQGEYCPYVSPDNRYILVEIPGAPGGFGGGDLYISRRQEDGTWGKPVNLGPAFNSSADDCYPVPSAGGTFFIFMSNRTPEAGVMPATPPSVKEPFDFYWIRASALDPFLLD